jgi:HAD superfamily hydrolase (TIGR01549 family)
LFSEYGAEKSSAFTKFHLENQGVNRYYKIDHFYKHIACVAATEADIQRKSEQFSQLVRAELLQTPLIDGVCEFLREHARHIEMYIVSAAPQNELDEIVESRNIRRYFRDVHGFPTKKTTVIAEYLRRFPEHRSSCVMVGDTISDYKAARETGISFFGFNFQDPEDEYGLEIRKVYSFHELANIMVQV